jgi:lipoate---protein ligase
MEYFTPELSPNAPPADFLAQDEALLGWSESTGHPGFLSFWESRTYFVVLGYSKKIEEEVFEDECDRLGIPILRRESGGGTVLQGPGCLNYTLVLPIESAPELETITGANRYIMQRTRTALASLVPGKLEIQGHTDLTLDGLKFCGNAQRRKRRCLLFHGAFLLEFDLTLISKTLRLPRQQPDYRKNRPHESFLTNLHVDSARVKAALIDAWNTKGNSSLELHQEIAAKMKELVATKYSTDEWNRRGSHVQKGH